jgi:hypothetical protein
MTEKKNPNNETDKERVAVCARQCGAYVDKPGDVCDVCFTRAFAYSRIRHEWEY